MGLGSEQGSVVEAAPREPARRQGGVRVWPWALATGAVVAVLAAGVLFAWTVNETHFDRPSEQFDQFGAEIAGIPGVESVDNERWVEAPTFSHPTSWMSVSVSADGLSGVIEAACASDYADPVTWTIRVGGAAEVTLNAGPPAPAQSDGARACPDFGFDAVSLVDELGRVAPGLAVQPAVWDDGRFALVALEVPSGFTSVLPLVSNAGRLLEAAGLPATGIVEINSQNLGFTFEPGERDRCVALLTELAEEYGASSFWVTSADASADGTGNVQVVAPAAQHDAIEEAIRSSGLSFARDPVSFLEQ